jgi:hypothetical protein
MTAVAGGAPAFSSEQRGVVGDLAVTVTHVCRRGCTALKFGRSLPIHTSGDQETQMINPISSVHPPVVQQVAHAPAEAKPDPHAQTPPVRKSGEVSQDQVTLKSAGQVDHER